MRISACLMVLLLGSPALADETWADEPWKAPRTAFGAPDLAGVWNNNTATPLERPAAFNGPTTTQERAAAFEKTSATAFLGDESDGVGGRQSESWEMPAHMTRIGGQIRTSLIVDPPDGKLPLSPEGRATLAARMRANLNDFDGPEARPSPERCFTGGSGSTGAPIFTARYNGNYRIVQTATHIAIQMEQANALRIIPIGGRRSREGFPHWLGESVAHWEDDTLVVETRSFHPGDAFKPAAPLYVSASAVVTERFTRIAPGEILYAYSVDDPEAYTRAWRVEQVLYATANPIFEYACHEGNYAVANALKGGRAAERRVSRKPR